MIARFLRNAISFALTSVTLGAFAYILLPTVKGFVDGRIFHPKTPTEITQATELSLSQKLAERDLSKGAPTFIRIFKEESQLEVWMEKDGIFHLFDQYEICNFSGELGPKLKEGDRQSPEGFYTVGLSALNPNSSYHLSFNLGFPNAFDRSHGRTGSYLMVHGNCVSIGCYAMTDKNIEEIYALVEAALRAGQSEFQVHAFPFRMTDERMAQAAGNQWIDFWKNLKLGYDRFETTRQPPTILVHSKSYVFR